MAALELVFRYMATLIADWGDVVVSIADEIPI